MEDISENKKNSGELLQLVSFLIGNEEFGIDILAVKEINRMTEITKMPNSPGYVEGVMNLRGKVIPIVDLRIRLGLPKKENDKNTRIIVLEISGKTIGFIVDAVKEVLRVPDSIMEAPPDIASGVNSEFIKSVAKLDDRLLIIIDQEQLLTAGEKKELAKIKTD